MKKENIIKLSMNFDSVVQKEANLEFWYARDLQKLLDYSEWRNFKKVIDKAMLACKNSQYDIVDHFVDVNKMVQLGSDSERETKDYKLTRYACYLIAQNGDPRKETIAIQTTKKGLMQKLLTGEVRAKIGSAR